MKKRIVKITGMALTLMVLFTGALAPNKAYAADESAKYLKGAKLVVGLDGKNDVGTEVIVAMYTNKKGDQILYINDGKNHAYTSYTTESGYSEDVGCYQDICINDVPTYRYCVIKNIPYLITDSADIFTCQYVDAYEMSQIMSYD